MWVGGCRRGVYGVVRCGGVDRDSCKSKPQALVSRELREVVGVAQPELFRCPDWTRDSCPLVACVCACSFTYTISSGLPRANMIR